MSTVLNILDAFFHSPHCYATSDCSLTQLCYDMKTALTKATKSRLIPTCKDFFSLYPIRIFIVLSGLYLILFFLSIFLCLSFQRSFPTPPCLFCSLCSGAVFWSFFFSFWVTQSSWLQEEVSQLNGNWLWWRNARVGWRNPLDKWEGAQRKKSDRWHPNPVSVLVQ